MPGGSAPSRRRVIGSVESSVLLYVAPVESKALTTARNRVMIMSVQRRVALRIISAYRTVSNKAPLIELLARTADEHAAQE